MRHFYADDVAIRQTLRRHLPTLGISVVLDDGKVKSEPIPADGCSCGWLVPSGSKDAADAWIEHVVLDLAGPTA